MSGWERVQIAPCGTHHLRDGEPLYAVRFDEVLAFHSPGLAAVRRGAAAWHADGQARAAYARRFGQTFGFYEGRAAARTRDPTIMRLLKGLWLAPTSGLNPDWR